MPSEITYQNGQAISFSGPDAMALWNAVTLRSGLGLLAVGIKPNRHWTLRAALETATKYTGKIYSGKKDIERARADLKVWCDTMRAAIPSRTI